jgi:hypothetical protein
MDRQLVHFLSSFHPPTEVASISRVDSKGKEITLSFPSAVRDYNSFKGGVDVLDQLHSYYSILRKSRRWWPRLAWWLFDAAISNAHRLYQVSGHPKCSALDFRMNLLLELAAYVKAEGSIKGMKRGRMENNRNKDHQLIHVDQRGDCLICHSSEKRRSRVYFKCAICSVFVCATPCYDIHRKCNDM